MVILDCSGGGSGWLWFFWKVVQCGLVLVLSSSRYLAWRFWVVVGVVLGLSDGGSWLFCWWLVGFRWF